VQFHFSEKVKDLQRRLQAFMDEHVYPNERRFHEEIAKDRWSPSRVIEEAKSKTSAAGLSNLFAN
jgi:acyl-CoA dehydrogenase